MKKSLLRDFAMTARSFKTNIFVLEGVNAFATGLYFNWLFYFTQNRLHFSVAQNLSLVALHGLTYTASAWFGGWFGHRYGKFSALKTGFSIMAVALLCGAIFPLPLMQVFVLLGWTFGMCFTWPTLQALVSDGANGRDMPRIAGIYNIVWSAVSAGSYFFGGFLLEHLGLLTLFWLPAIVHLAQLTFVLAIENQTVETSAYDKAAIETEATEPMDPRTQKKFLRLALLSNPIAYVAINTVIPVIPVVAHRFELSPAMTGMFCSIWFFTRMGAFTLFWLWPGWHYRFGFLLAAKIGLVVSFLGVLLAPQLWILLVAQVVFGISVGLIYYSSLYYSLHGGNAKTEHGGLHEAMIGFGTLLGAIVGVSAKYFFPKVQSVSIWAVSGLLILGVFALISLRYGKETG